MHPERPEPIDQATLWNGSAGQAWVDAQALLDALFEPIERRLVDDARRRSARRVLDVGCGSGATTLAIARALPAGGRGTGVDISQPLITAARARADAGTNADFVCADAQRHAFDAGAYDLLVSRFGLMFFDDPVAAFSNLRRAATHDASLCGYVWRSPAENPFITTAERAARPWLPRMPVADPHAPGQFAFAERDRVARILAGAGWADVAIDALDVPMRFPAASLERYFTRLGPLGRMLADVDASTRARIVSAAHEAFAPFVHGDDVRFDAACWRIVARSTTAAGAGGSR
ncbi:class I SAM-dependent methyltransferase [Dokdonella fugitiva]|uniref:Methyltransferase family protein n=1 Tax=Dokdonella fugitiva TaxID=328517 RepID=A0A4R2I724_9GAMM|nr:class I SAM-dependent methyltransferase [Dokdonella fugitiva]TCO40074.1 methyltransferase family protein [Dokdonella fugitiva]